MRKKKTSKVELPDFYENLDFDYTTVPTALDTFDIMSCGGIKEGTVTEIYGPNASGKSAFAYATASKYLKKYSDAEVWIIDAENSFDKIRLEHVFDIDLSRVRKFDAQYLEEAYENVINAVNYTKDNENGTKRVLVIVDTIASLIPRAEIQDLDESHEVKMWSSGMGMISRVNADGLAKVVSKMTNSKVTFFILNQVRAKIGSYIPGFTSSGGNAKDHYNHYKFFFKKKEVITDKSDNTIGIVSDCRIEKSKFTPTTKILTLLIDVRLGGKVVPNEELLFSCRNLDIISNNGGWWYITDDEYKKKYDLPLFRWKNVSDPSHEHSKLFREHLIELLTKYYRSRYYTVNLQYEQFGIETGKPDNPIDDTSIDPIEINYEKYDPKEGKKKNKDELVKNGAILKKEEESVKEIA